MISKTAGKSGAKTGGRKETKLTKYMRKEGKYIEHTCAIRLLDRVTPSSRMNEKVGNKGDVSRMSQR